MIRRPPRSTLSSSSAASDVYKRQSTQSTGKPRSTMASPRVGKSHLAEYDGKTVRFVGKVKSNDGGVAVLEAPDGGEVQVHNSTPYQTQFVEILGSVQSAGAISQQSYVDFGDEFHMGNYNELLRLTHGNRVRGLFE
eukprot:TRINITY_DN12499_c0_g1_i1.p1 TRINITY_DN12499_c0_g1~~TRINITY_DN12499_c0_g1_i1.p1  ORF type:complete len:137 (+),score=24.49 TRINITY_DN12499_c0_g1_i1:95-505(+)